MSLPFQFKYIFLFLSFSFCNQFLFCFDVFLNIQEGDYYDENSVCRDFEAQEKEGCDGFSGKGWVVVEEIEDGYGKPVYYGEYGVVDGHGNAIYAVAKFGFQVIQDVGEEGHHNVGTGDAGQAL